MKKEKIHDEILDEVISNEEEENEQKTNNYFILKTFLTLFIILLLILMVLPFYSLKFDSNPKNIPTKNEIYAKFYSNISVEDINRPTNGSIVNYVDYLSYEIKLSSTKIATDSCDDEKICQAKAIYYFVRDSFKYVSETDEYIQTPKEMVLSGGGDCDDFAVLLASKMLAIGIPVRFVFVPKHVYIQIYVEDAKKKYLDDGWINLDATCMNCKFGEILNIYQKYDKSYLFAY
ncbi:MAG: transglutaminase-like domain-containing protein [Nanoarchaeota archaeon]